MTASNAFIASSYLSAPPSTVVASAQKAIVKFGSLGSPEICCKLELKNVVLVRERILAI